MQRRRQIWLSGLALMVAGSAIWARDWRWTESMADTLPLLLGLPLAYLLGRPWQPGSAVMPPVRRGLAAASVLVFAGGWILGNLTLLTISWTVLTTIWAAWAFVGQARRGRLGWLLVLSFPWLVLEWPAIGWYFRLSSAAVAEHLFRLLQLPTLREGTHLNVLGVPINIEASCAGWNLLQLTLLAGVAFGSYEIRPAGHFAVLLCLLPAIAWLANLFRILILTGIALSFDAQVASGAIHGLTGLAVLGFVLAITKGLCLLLGPARAVSSRIVSSS